MNINLKKYLTLLFQKAYSESFSQNPTYTLDATNFAVYDNYMEWDIYLSHTNPPIYFEYAGGQYFFGFNPLISGSGISNLRYKVINGSDMPSNMQPRIPSISTASNPSQSVLRLAINSFPGAGFGYMMTNNGTPGSRIVRLRLETIDSANFVSGQSLDLAWRNPPTVTIVTKIYSYIGTLITELTTPSTHYINGNTGNVIKFNLTVLMEGMYDNATNQLKRKDSLKVHLKNSFAPNFTVDSAAGSIDSLSLTGLYNSLNASSGTNYIAVSHFNCIETWSKSGGESLSISTTGNYNFTISSAQAFGNNLNLKGSKYKMFSGDVNKDGIIDGTDLSEIDNDAYSFTTGLRIPTDLNGDNITDDTDFLIGDNNRNFISVIVP